MGLSMGHLHESFMWPLGLQLGIRSYCEGSFLCDTEMCKAR